MDDSSFLGIPGVIWWLVLFVFVILFIVFVVRKVVEGAFPHLVARPFWRERFLPVFPIALGLIIAVWSKTFHFPDGVSTPFTRGCLGMVLGGASGWVYKIVKAKVKTTWGVDIGFSNPPPGMGMKVTVKVPPMDKTPAGSTIETTVEPTQAPPPDEDTP